MGQHNAERDTKMKGRIRNQGVWLSLGIGKQSVLDRVAQDRETSTSPPRLSCPADKRHTGTGPAAAAAAAAA